MPAASHLTCDALATAITAQPSGAYLFAFLAFVLVGAVASLRIALSEADVIDSGHDVNVSRGDTERKWP